MATTASRRANPLILLVDDFEDALTMYEEYLEHRGYHVIVARNGEEAVNAAKRHDPDLILLDLRMPGMSGTEALQVLRSDPAFATTPILALTAHALENERLQALADGFDLVVPKPCLPDELVDIIQNRLRNQSDGV
jgi:CheY-like chemotaxis protein